MKPINEELDSYSAWIQDASDLHNRIQNAKMNIDKIFPKQEFTQPISTVDLSIRSKIMDFLNFDKDKLVSVHILEVVLNQARQNDIPKGNILFKQLRDVYRRANENKKIIIQYSGSQHKTYPEAKLILSEILKNGVWIEEAEIIKKIISVNKKIENALFGDKEECLPKLKEVSEADGKYIDPGFKINIASRFHEIELIQRKIEILLSKPMIGFEDFIEIKEMENQGQQFPFFIPNFEKLLDIHTAFSWAVRVAYAFGTRSNDLQDILGSLLYMLFDLRTSTDVTILRDIFEEILNVKFSMQPFTEIVSETKYVFWVLEVREYYQREHMHLKELERLLDKAPVHTDITSGACPTMRNIREHVRTAHAWKNEAERLIRQAGELRTCAHEEFTRRMNSTFSHIEEVVKRVNDDYTEDLQIIEELNSVKAGLEQAKKILIMAKCIHTLNSNKKIEITHFTRAKELYSSTKSVQFRNDTLFLAFRRLARLFSDEMKILKFFLSKINTKETHLTPKLYDPKLIEYAKSLQNIDIVVEALSRVEDHVNLGDIGASMKEFCSNFKNTEADLLSLEREHSSKNINELGLDMIESLLQQFEEKKQKWHIRVCSNHLETMGRFEWLLNVYFCLKSPKVKLEELESLRSSRDIALPEDKDVVKQLEDLINSSNVESEDIAIILNQGGYDINELQNLRERVNSSQVVLSDIKRRVDQELTEYEMIHQDFDEMKRLMREGNDFPFVEIKLLFHDLLEAKFKAPELEEELRHAVTSIEDMLANLKKADTIAEFASLIKICESMPYKIAEIQAVLKNRDLAVRFLETENLPIEQMNIGELNIVKKCISTSMAESFEDLYGKRILQRKCKVLMTAEIDGPEEIKGHNLLLSDFKGFMQAMMDHRESFSDEELEWVQDKLSQITLYLEEIKKLKEEQIKKCNMILFNFLDISPEIQKLYTTKTEIKIHRESPEVKHMKIFSNLEDLQGSEKKEYRKEWIRNLRGKLTNLSSNLEKNEAEEAAKNIEVLVFRHTKSSMTLYQNIMEDYDELLGKLEGCEAWGSYFAAKPIPVNILSDVLKRNPSELREYTDLKSIRRFLRNVSQQGTDKEEKNSRGYLGKRLLGDGFLSEELEVITGKKKIAAVPKAVKLPPEFENNYTEISLESSEEESEEEMNYEMKSDSPLPEKSESQHLKPQKSQKSEERPVFHKPEQMIEEQHETDKLSVDQKAEEEEEKKEKGSKMSLDFERSEDGDEGSDYEGGSEDFWKENEGAEEDPVKKPVEEKAVIEEPKSMDEEMEDDEEPYCWEIYDGNVRVTSGNVTSTRLSFISLSDKSVISKLPDLTQQQMTFDKSISLEKFEEETLKIRNKVLNGKAINVSGFIYSKTKHPTSIKVLKKQKSMAWSGQATNDIKVFLISPRDLSGGTQFMIDHCFELKKLDVDFFFIMTFDLTSLAYKTLVPKVGSTKEWEKIKEEFGDEPSRSCVSDFDEFEDTSNEEEQRKRKKPKKKAPETEFSDLLLLNTQKGKLSGRSSENDFESGKKSRYAKEQGTDSIERFTGF
jgi:hypothetical protein